MKTEWIFIIWELTYFGFYLFFLKNSSGSNVVSEFDILSIFLCCYFTTSLLDPQQFYKFQMYLQKDDTIPSKDCNSI